MSRRYKIGVHPPYDLEFNRLTNPASRPRYDFLSARDHSKAGVERVISEFQVLAERRKQEIEAIDLKYSNLKVTARREGKTEPAEMPRQLLDERLRLEAQVDAITERVAEFTQEMAEFEAREQAEQDAKILLNGPIGSGKLKRGILSEIDGQPIRVNRKGVLIIDCPKSPYHKMRVDDYRSYVVAPFAKARAEKSREFEDAVAKKMRELQELRKLRPVSGGTVSRENLPPRPKGY